MGLSPGCPAQRYMSHAGIVAQLVRAPMWATPMLRAVTRLPGAWWQCLRIRCTQATASQLMNRNPSLTAVCRCCHCP